MNATEAQIDRPAQGAHELGLAKTRYAFDQHVATGDEADDGVAHDLALTDNELAHLADNGGGQVAKVLGLAFRGFRPVNGECHGAAK